MTAEIDHEKSLSLAVQVVLHFGEMSYNQADWEKLVGKANLRPLGCLIDVLRLPCPPERREDISFRVAQLLREKYPQYTGSPARWRRKFWTEADASQIVEVVSDGVAAVIAETEQVFCDADDYVPRSLVPAAPDEFVPWRLFRRREPTSGSPGVYLLAYFDGAPAEVVDPQSDSVIYIGKAEDQSTADRLRQFERTALGGLGHLAGFNYRVEFVRDFLQNDFQRLLRFHNTYCSWRDVEPPDALSPAEVESVLLRQYQERWGRLPVLNKKSA